MSHRLPILLIALVLITPRARVNAAEPHPVDEVLNRYFAAHGIETLPPIPDRLWLRRASLDLVGLLPAPGRVQQFEADPAPDKYERLIDELLADREAYATHWLTFWSDALRNAYRGTGFIDNGRSQITRWLFAALYHNLPYDQFVHQLISPVEGSEGFTRGIKWRGVVNESQRPEIQAAQNVAQVFLGTNLKCASCHDSFVNDWKLADAYRLASVFAEQPLEIHHCDKPTGEISSVGYIDEAATEIPAHAPRTERMQQLADLVVHRDNDRFARVMVNRLWARMFGRGIIEPLDNIDNEPVSAELLELLTRDFIDHGYDIKRTLRLIATSRAYRLPATDNVGQSGTSDDEPHVFRGPLVKRMTAEQFVDAVATVTGQPLQATAADFNRDGRQQGGQLADIAAVLRTDSPVEPPLDVASARRLLAQGKWVWSHAGAAQAAVGEQSWFRTTVTRQPGERVALVITADNEWELFVNANRLASSDNWERPAAVDLTAHMREGENIIGIAARNAGNSPNPAGVIAAIGIHCDGNWHLETATGNDRWVSSRSPAPRWLQPGFAAKGWTSPSVVAPADAAPWKMTTRITHDSLDGSADPAQVWKNHRLRAALLSRDTLQTALGRPNREQPVTQRESRATLLQALELTNGHSLDELLNVAADGLQTQQLSHDELITDLFLRALSRPPTANEQQLAVRLLDAESPSAGIADLLWTILMLPEFQLVH